MTVLLFEDEKWRNFAAIALIRPLFELRCGALTLRERAGALLAGQAPAMPQPAPIGLCRAHLAGCFGAEGGVRTLLSESTPLTLVNGRALDLGWLPDLLAAPPRTVFVLDGELAGARLSPALASAVLYYLREQRVSETLSELERFCRVVDITSRAAAPLLAYPWDLIGRTGEQIVRDEPLLAARLPLYEGKDPQVVVRGAAHVRVAPSARLDGPLVLDARDGPVLIDEGAHIEPFSFIQGPVYIGRNTLIASALIRGETSFGPTCRIGGEVEASVVQGFSNKHHEGFLGHSWLGEWVNIGAMTTNSDLKNNYGTIRMAVEGFGQVDSGMIKLGCFLADHVKLGIGIHLNGGTVISTGSNIFGVHLAPKTIPAFIWGGETFREYRIDGMVKVTRTVMGRRKRVLAPEYEELLRAAFMMTRGSRGSLVETLTLPQSGAPLPAEAALERAEREAISAFETV